MLKGRRVSTGVGDAGSTGTVATSARVPAGCGSDDGFGGLGRLPPRIMMPFPIAASSVGGTALGIVEGGSIGSAVVVGISVAAWFCGNTAVGGIAGAELYGATGCSCEFCSNDQRGAVSP